MMLLLPCHPKDLEVHTNRLLTLYLVEESVI